MSRHGFLFDLSDHQLLQEGVTSKERVLKIMGSPTIISNLDSNETWIYYSEDVKNLLFFIPDITSRTIVTLKFDDSDTVKKIEKFDLENEAKEMKFLSQYTYVKSKKIGFFKSLFSNVGQVKAQ
jgi:outer membrane protein assembly factor BamE (lipoprotein component of BamABCDE complex)